MLPKTTKVMLLAAGKGVRMDKLTQHCPKPMLPLNGKPIIAHTIERLRQTGFTDLIINTAYLGDIIEANLGDGSQLGVHITYSRELVDQFETGGGIKNALPLLGDQPFLLVNGDIFTEHDFASLPATIQGAHLILANNPAHNPKGDFHLQQGKIRLLSNTESDTTYTYTGIAILHPQLFANHATKCHFPLRDILYPAIEQGLVTGSLHQGHWCDIGTPERLKATEQYLG